METVNQDTEIKRIKLAELRFRLASLIKFAIRSKSLSFNTETSWVYGEQTAYQKELALTRDQSELAAHLLFHSSTHELASVLKESMVKVCMDGKGQIKDIFDSKRELIERALRISNIIRTAYSDNSGNPVWKIPKDKRNTDKIVLENIISLDLNALNGKPVLSEHYGGPLALFRLSRFVRKNLLGDNAKQETLLEEFKGMLT